jgi:voltage-gated potassium channel
MQKRTIKEICNKAFNDVNARSFVLVNDFFAILTIISVFVIVLETVQRLSGYTDIFLFIEFGAVFFFFLEYVGRLIAADRPLKYMRSFFGIIDLIAIVPSFLGVANLTFLKSVRFLRVLRFLRMIRLAKLVRMHKGYDDIEDHGHDALFSLTVQIYVATFITAILFSGTMIWFFEGGRVEFSNIPYAMIWSSKVLLGGVSQTMPQTVAGEIVVIVTRFVGLILFGLLISIVGGSVKRLLLGTKEK